MTKPKPADKTSAWHRTDYLSLIFGLLFLATAGWWAAAYYLDWVFDVRLPDAGWVLAAGLIVLGLVGILASLRRDRRDLASGDGDGPPASESTGEAGPLAAGGRGAEPDQPTAGDPGGHRPE